MCERLFPGSIQHRLVAVRKQLRSLDVAGVVGCEKDRGLRALVGCEPVERDSFEKTSFSVVAPVPFPPAEKLSENRTTRPPGQASAGNTKV